MHCPFQKHLDAVYRILRYLKASPGKGLFFRKSKKRGVEAYSDVDWDGSVEDRKSTSGYCTFLRGNLVTWKSTKQNVVDRSSAEAKLRALAQGTYEIIWTRRLMEELKLTCLKPLKIFL